MNAELQLKAIYIAIVVISLVAIIWFETRRQKRAKQVTRYVLGFCYNAEASCRETDGSAQIAPADEGFAPFKVSAAFVAKHKPEAGGYYVRYEDGYESYSPAKAFEDGYTRIP